MADWSFLSRLLEKLQSTSTVVGMIWLNALFVFRVLLLAAGLQQLWGDKESGLICDTLYNGCDKVCYDIIFPISHFRFWVLQIIFVSTPTLVFLAYVVLMIHREEKMRQTDQQGKQDELQIMKDDKKLPKYNDREGKFSSQGYLLWSYVVTVIFKILLEVAFIVGQFYLFDFLLHRRYTCIADPCELRVNCYFSRATEKSIFLLLTMVVAGVSLLLNAVEICCLFGGKVKEAMQKKNYADCSELLVLSEEMPPCGEAALEIDNTVNRDENESQNRLTLKTMENEAAE
ncbi:gap junction Cx32.2 protein [Amia ocellicauda]|uniref:gap junction Cx32.2 protein n=1 Tax=Amia ocellicauda TaxID=2972642 RepID=UPI00346386E2